MKIQRPKSKLPLPPSAKRVFKGVIFDVYQWPQKLFDGSVVTYEKVKRKDTVNVIGVTLDRKFIITEQEQSGLDKFIGLPGGKVDEGEDLEKAAGRELLEETGYEAKELVLWDAVQPGEKVDWASYTFVARGCRKVKEVEAEAGEKVSVELVDFDEFLAEATRLGFRDSEVVVKLMRDGVVKYALEKSKVVRLKKLFFGSD